MLLEAAGQGTWEGLQRGVVGRGSKGWAQPGHMVQPGCRVSLTFRQPAGYQKALP